jgi:hypothetical protein
MDNTTAALLGTLIGSSTALISSVLTNLVVLRNERARRDDAKATTDTLHLRQHIAVVFAEMFAVQHAINWIAWHAKHDPDAVDVEMLRAYETAIDNSYPKLLGAMAMVAALDLQIYTLLQPIAKGLYALDEKVAIALRRLKSNRSIAIATLQGYKDQAEILEDSLPPELSRIMEIAARGQER